VENKASDEWQQTCCSIHGYMSWATRGIEKQIEECVQQMRAMATGMCTTACQATAIKAFDTK
jgi:hypothetical protein